MLTILPKSLLAVAAFAAAATAVLGFLGFNIPASHAAGWRHEPWCAFFEYDDTTMDCSYRTVEECTANVIGGIRGNCGPNPDGASPQTPMPAAPRKHKKQRAQP